MDASAADKRQYRRLGLVCPITLGTGVEEPMPMTSTRTLNLSDGGALVSVPVGVLPPIGSMLAVQFAVPRSTQNTYMLEGFACQAQVVRHMPLKDSHRLGVALRFIRPLTLGLEA